MYLYSFVCMLTWNERYLEKIINNPNNEIGVTFPSLSPIQLIRASGLVMVLNQGKAIPTQSQRHVSARKT